jgi:hypothetical protein
VSGGELEKGKDNRQADWTHPNDEFVQLAEVLHVVEAAHSCESNHLCVFQRMFGAQVSREEDTTATRPAQGPMMTFGNIKH